MPSVLKYIRLVHNFSIENIEIEPLFLVDEQMSIEVITNTEGEVSQIEENRFNICFATFYVCNMFRSYIISCLFHGWNNRCVLHVRWRNCNPLDEIR